MNLTFRRPSSSFSESKIEAGRRVRSWRPLASPMEAWLAEHLIAAHGSRVAIFYLWNAWTRHAESNGIDPGERAELVRLIRAKYPKAEIVKGLSGRDGHPGRKYLTELRLR